MVIYTVKTIIGRENVVLESIANKAKVNGLNIKSLVHPEEIKGYIFVEGELKDIQEVIKEIPHARGILRDPVDINQIKKMIETKKKEIDIKEGDIVEVVGGPFKGEKGKVTRYDKDKGEVTIELIEVTVPIPVTVNAGLVSVIQKSGDRNE
ncbi:MAG: transcription elongation factor Spt5 [Candidatus Aenigmatarchaeota archaeon]|nr:transcription elongation factor Spt5 [Candidatus Aenigmarchaeota archaeon]